MNAQNKLIKSSALALAALFVGNSQISAAAQSPLLWTEYFKNACKTGGERSQASIRAPRFETDAKRSTALIWAGISHARTPRPRSKRSWPAWSAARAY